MSGSILVDDEARTVSKNVALAEKVDSDRTIRQADRYYVDENMMQNLPDGVAVVYGLGLAKFAQVCNLKTVKHAENIQVQAVEGVELSAPEEFI